MCQALCWVRVLGAPKVKKTEVLVSMHSSSRTVVSTEGYTGIIHRGVAEKYGYPC